MGLGDKISNAADEAKGKVKEAWGDATDNERLEAEGKADQAVADVKQAGSLLRHFKRPLDRSPGGNVTPPIGEGVGRDVHDAHDDGARQVEHMVGKPQLHAGILPPSCRRPQRKRAMR